MNKHDFFKNNTLTMQKKVLIFILSLFIVGTIKAQEQEQEDLVDHFSFALIHGIKHNHQDTLESIYPSLDDVKNFLNSNSLEENSIEDWNELKAERAESLEYYFENIKDIREEANEVGLDLDKIELKDVTFQVDSEVGAIELNEIRMDYYSLDLYITDGEKNLRVIISDAILLNNSIKVIEIDDWIFD